MTDDELTAEHERLRMQTLELQREPEALQRQADPDGSLHAEHKLKIQHKIAELREHMKRLTEARQVSTNT